MALLRFSSDLDPVSNLLTLQTELERFLRNPAIRLGVSGPGDFPPVNIFDDGDGSRGDGRDTRDGSSKPQRLRTESHPDNQG